MSNAGLLRECENKYADTSCKKKTVFLYMLLTNINSSLHGPTTMVTEHLRLSLVVSH